MTIDFKETEWVSTPIAGDDLTAVAEKIAGMQEAATTEWWPNLSYETTGSTVSSVMVSLVTKVTVPEWTGYDAAPSAEQDEWRRFCSAMKEHEQGHLNLVFDALGGIDDQLLGMTVEDAKKRWAEKLQAIASIESDYDSETDHGRNRGTVIDVSVANSQGEE